MENKIDNLYKKGQSQENENQSCKRKENFEICHESNFSKSNFFDAKI